MKKNNETEKHTNRLSFGMNVLIGAFAGATEPLVNQPALNLKIQAQSTGILNFRPRILYKGLIPNSFSMIPGTAIQIGIFELIRQNYFKHKEPDNRQRFGLAFIAGAFSALFTAPAELFVARMGQEINASSLSGNRCS